VAARARVERRSAPQCACGADVDSYGGAKGDRKRLRPIRGVLQPVSSSAVQILFPQVRRHVVGASASLPDAPRLMPSQRAACLSAVFPQTCATSTPRARGQPSVTVASREGQGAGTTDRTDTWGVETDCGDGERLGNRRGRADAR